MANENEISKFSIDGLGIKFKVLSDGMKYKAARYGARRGANLIARALKQNVSSYDDPETPENIAKNIAVRFSSRTFRRTGDIMFRVGVRGGAKNYAATDANRRAGRVGKAYATGGDKSNPGGDTWYWRFREFGTEHEPAKPVFRPTLENNIAAATDEVVGGINRWIDREFKKVPGVT